ncbi:MAG: hypothetical protein ACOCY6_05890 [Halodesulfurarchaeum sp.]
MGQIRYGIVGCGGIDATHAEAVDVILAGTVAAIRGDPVAVADVPAGRITEAKDGI